MKRTGKKMIGVKMDPDLVKWLEAEAVAQRVSVSDILRGIVLRKMEESRSTGKGRSHG